MTDAIRNAFGGRGSRADRYEYNPLGESLMDNEAQGNQEGAEDGQEANARPRNESSSGEDSRTGRAASKVNEWGRSLKQRWQSFIAGSGSSNPPRRTAEEDGWSSALQQDSSADRLPPTVSRAPPQIQRPDQGVTDQEPVAELDIRSTVATARATGELLQDITQEAGRNPVEAIELADTMNDLSRVCEATQRELAIFLSNESLWEDEATLNSALEVNDLLTRALAVHARLMGVNSSTQVAQPEETHLPQQQEGQETEPLTEEQNIDMPISTPPTIDERTGPQESEEDMMARAIAASLQSEEERKARAEKEAKPPEEADLLGDLNAPLPTPASQLPVSAAALQAFPQADLTSSDLLGYDELQTSCPAPSDPVNTSPAAEGILVPTSQPVIPPPPAVQDEFSLMAAEAVAVPPQPAVQETNSTANTVAAPTTSLIDL